MRAALARVTGTPIAGKDASGGDIAAGENSDPAQRDQMIRGMVQRLADRLHADGNDVDGWLRLVRAYIVLGDPDKAKDAAADARHALPDPDAVQRIDDLVKDWAWRVDGHAAESSTMTRKQRRLVLIGGGLGVLAVAVALVLNAMRDSIVFFNSPTDVAEKHVGPGKRFRLGGTGQDGQPGARRQSAGQVRGDRRQQATFRSPIRESCPTCSAKGRASSPKARSTAPACSRPTPCWPSTTRTTCRRKSPTP